MKKKKKIYRKTNIAYIERNLKKIIKKNKKNYPVLDIIIIKSEKNLDGSLLIFQTTRRNIGGEMIKIHIIFCGRNR